MLFIGRNKIFIVSCCQRTVSLSAEILHKVEKNDLTGSHERRQMQSNLYSPLTYAELEVVAEKFEVWRNTEIKIQFLACNVWHKIEFLLISMVPHHLMSSFSLFLLL